MIVFPGQHIDGGLLAQIFNRFMAFQSSLCLRACGFCGFYVLCSFLWIFDDLFMIC